MYDAAGVAAEAEANADTDVVPAGADVGDDGWRGQQVVYFSHSNL